MKIYSQWENVRVYRGIALLYVSTPHLWHLAHIYGSIPPV